MKRKVSILIITLLSQNLFAESKIDLEQSIKSKRFESIDWYNVDSFNVYHKLSKNNGYQKEKSR